MAQMGFFDLSDRYASLDAKRDPLLEINSVVPWEEFRRLLEQVWRKPDADRKSRAGRKPMDAVLMFKTLVLSALTTCRMTTSSIRSATGFPSCGSLVWASGTGCPTPRRSGSIARLWVPGGQGGGSVRALRRASGTAGLYCAGRADP